jgi:hypothetical protein
MKSKGETEMAKRNFGNGNPIATVVKVTWKGHAIGSNTGGVVYLGYDKDGLLAQTCGISYYAPLHACVNAALTNGNGKIVDYIHDAEWRHGVIDIDG